MKRQIVLIVLFTLLTQGSFVTYAITDPSEKKIRERSAKVKAAVARLGVGEAARVEVKLNDKTKLKGHIRAADENDFVIVDKNGIATAVEYSAVKQIKGNNLSTGAKIAIGIGIAVGVLIFLALLVDD